MHAPTRHRRRRVSLIGLAALLVIGGILYALFPRGGSGPETVARNFVEALLRAPNDTARLRAAAHLGEADNPEALIEGLSTRIALEYLRAREHQGARHDLSVGEVRRPDAEHLLAVVRVTGQASDGAALARRFDVSLQKTTNGDWRVDTVALGR